MPSPAIDPRFSDAYPEVVGDGTDFDLPLLLGGYALIAVAVAVVYRHHPSRPDWVRAGLRAGGTVALASFLGVHLVQAGYTTIDNPAWILSGLFDVAGPVLAGVAVGYVSDRGAHLQRLRQVTAGRGRGDRGPPW